MTGTAAPDREIALLATRFRDAIERCDRRHLPIGFATFPTGSCGDAALLLAHLLTERGHGPLDYVIGYRTIDGEERSHAWLKLANLAIDITADQFGDPAARVIVERDSPWHVPCAVNADSQPTIAAMMPAPAPSSTRPMR